MLILFNVWQKTREIFDYTLINIEFINSIAPAPFRRQDDPDSTPMPDGTNSIISTEEGFIFCADKIQDISCQLKGGH